MKQAIRRTTNGLLASHVLYASMETLSQSLNNMAQRMLDKVLIEYVPILQPGTGHPTSRRAVTPCLIIQS